MSDDHQRDGPPGRARVDELLGSAFADEAKFHESFLRFEAARQSRALAEALRSRRPEALRRLSTVVAEFLRKRIGREG
jgi:hypothetical protein